MIKKILFSIFCPLLLAYNLNFNYSESGYLANEIYFIGKEEVNRSLSIFPNVYNNNLSDNYFDFLQDNPQLNIYPIFGIRYGNGGFEVFENQEQIAVSRFYESLPKPWAIAIKELINDDINIEK